jgi:hypothetical protein
MHDIPQAREGGRKCARGKNPQRFDRKRLPPISWANNSVDYHPGAQDPGEAYLSARRSNLPVLAAPSLVPACLEIDLATLNFSQINSARNACLSRSRVEHGWQFSVLAQFIPMIEMETFPGARRPIV